MAKKDYGDLIAPQLEAQGGLLAALNAIQARERCVTEAAIAALADAFNLTKAEVRGVVSFYDDYSNEPRGKHVIRICQAEACQAVGSRNLTARALDRLGLELGGTTADGHITIESVYCLGLCASGPALMVDGNLRGRMDDACVEDLISRLEITQ